MHLIDAQILYPPNMVRAVIITAFVMLAVLLPESIMRGSPPNRTLDRRILSWTIWLIFLGGTLAQLHFWDKPLLVDVTIVRIAVACGGFWYVARNRSRRPR